MRIAAMSPADVGRAIDWAAAEGWNPGLDDAAAFRAADPGGFLMGWLDATPVAAIAAVRHSRGFGFVGLYIVREGWRGKGYGLAIWKAGLARLGERTIGLDGVAAQQANYARAGFVASHRTQRYHGKLTPAPAPEVVPIAPGHLPSLLALDREASGVDRRAYLTAWFRDTPRRHTLVLERDGAVEGYGTIRTCGSGAKIGPLHAAHPHNAQLLLGTLAVHAPADGGVSLDIPEPNYAGTALARDLRLQPVFETARMFRGPPPDLDHTAVFAEISLELG